MNSSKGLVSPKKNFKLKSNSIICIEQNLNLPSNLLQKKKNVLQQMRMLKTSQNSRINIFRQPITLMSKTFTNYRDDQKADKYQLQMLIEQNPIQKKEKSKQKKNKNPLYKRLCDIQAQSKQLSGVSFSKLLSRMMILQSQDQIQKKYYSDYKKNSYHTVDTKLRKTPNYECLQSKLFTIECPQNKRESSKTSPKKSRDLSPVRTAQPVSNKLFRRYFNPHGEKNESISSIENIEFDERYIYRNGKKTECKRIHNFYTSNMFRKSYDRHMRNTIDTFYHRDKNFN